jgi:glutathione peroxidase
MYEEIIFTAIMLLSLTIMDASAINVPKALDFEIKRLGEDKVENLCQYKGKVILVVNTASKCGFTPQYEGSRKIIF